MSRSRHRVSRVLLVMLAASVAVFVVTFVVKQRQNRAVAAATTEGAGGTAVTADAAVPGGEPPAITSASDETDALVTQAPTGKTGTAAPLVKPVIATTAGGTTPTGAAPSATPTPSQVATIVLSSKPLADAKAKADAGKLLEARDIYNAALLSGKLSPDETRAAKAQLSELNGTVVFSPSRFDTDTWTGSFTVPPGGVLAKIAKRFDVSPELLQRVNDISDPRRLQAGQSVKIVRGPLHAVVDKSDFTLDLYFGAPGGPGSSYLTTFRVGLGANDSTPTGKWRCGTKLTNPTYHSPRGEGVIDGDDPANPLGDYWIALTGVEGGAVGKLSYGIHGTIEPDSIGKMASMGCIRMRNEDVARVYELLTENKSTVVVVE
jgi:lipoprotein-anchoring transpeptidase ErfK/SrfK